MDAGGAGNDEAAVGHMHRFRKVSSRYPHIVALAYEGDIPAAAQDTDEQVSRRVADFERSTGREPRDWVAIGKEERRSTVQALLREPDNPS